MHKLSLVGAVLGTSLAALAQTCNGAPVARTIATQTPFTVSFYGGQSIPVPPGYLGMCEFCDVTVNQTVSLSHIDKTTYDSGIGNPPTPNQVGNTTQVQIYTCPTSWQGNQTILPSAPGSPWTLAGTGTLTVNAYPATSPVVLAAPITLAAGSYGVALLTTPTTTGTNPGPLHVVYSTTTSQVDDQFVHLGPQAVQNNGFTSGIFAGNINVIFTYTPAANAALWTPFGNGCYFHPRAFYEDFPRGTPSVPDLTNTGIQMIPVSPNNYLVVAAPSVIAPHTTPSLTLSPPASSASTPGTHTDWDDSMTAPISLPFTFPYAGGSTNTITINSNGFIYLDGVVSDSFLACGAPYTLGPGTPNFISFQTSAARIAAFWADMQLTPAVNPLGGLFYEVDTNVPPHFVRITWEHALDFSSTTAINTFQLTLNDNGQVDISYGALALDGADSDAVVGFSTGNGAIIPNSQDLSATMPFTSGDGSIPPVLGMAPSGTTTIGRPVIGTAPNIVTTNITPGTNFVFLVMGFVANGTGLDLTPFGLPGCRDYVTPVSNILGPVVTGQASFGLNIPNNPALQNVQVFAQAAPLTPGLNPAGILTSNAICMKVGQ